MFVSSSHTKLPPGAERRCNISKLIGGSDYIYSFGGNGLLVGLLQLGVGLLVITQILLAANQNDGQTLTEMKNLGDPLDIETISTSSIL